MWKNIDRLPELADVLQNLGDFVEREAIDLVLMSGDVFDTGTPSAEAERLVFGFLKRIGQAGARTIVIGGNHDNAARLDAWGMLAELVNVHVVGRPRRAAAGGIVEIVGREGDRAIVACVPFAPPRGFISAVELAAGDTEARQLYAESLKAVVDHLAANFRPDTINFLVAHTHLEGALLSGSERQVHIGQEWAAAAQALPSQAHYVALGHIHKPQRVQSAPAPTCYAGSPLQLDFGEAGEEKSFVLVDARPRQPAHLERVPYRGGKQLGIVRATLDDLRVNAERLRGLGWLRVEIALSSRDPDINGKVRRLLPNAVSVIVELPDVEQSVAPISLKGLRPKDLYASYHRAEHGGEPDSALTEEFGRLWSEAESP